LCEFNVIISFLQNIEWLNGPAELVKAYEKFVLELLAAHNYYARLTIEKLVNSFKPGNT
jgi:hypothetical protein